MQRRTLFICALMVCLAIVLAKPTSGLAGRHLQSSDAGMQVSGAILDLQAEPGQSYVHPMVVTLGPTAPAMDIQVEARGFGESLSGEFIPLLPNEDTNPNSAREFITAIDKTSFHLEPGESMPVNATLQMPSELGNVTRYAIIYIHSQPVDRGDGVSQIQSTSVPIIITPKTLEYQYTGQISELKANPVEAGKPIEILTTLQNTGNHHYKVKGEVKVSNAEGQEVARLPLSLTTTSILPGYEQQLGSAYRALDRAEGLPVGVYTADVAITMEDGTLLDSGQTTFQVTAPFTPCPGVPEANIFRMSFQNEEPGVINALSSTGVLANFEDTGVISGSLVICKYAQEPDVLPHFSDDPGNGGTGQNGLSYARVLTEGFEQGVAHLGFQYEKSQLGDVDPNSLFLAYQDAEIWRKLGNLTVLSGAEQVVGDLPIRTLNSGPMIGMGGAQEIVTQAGFTPSGVNMTMIIIVAVIVFGLLIGLWIIMGSRRKPQKTMSTKR